MDKLGKMVESLRRVLLEKDQQALPMKGPEYVSRRECLELLEILTSVLDAFSIQNPSIEQGGTSASSQRRALIEKHLLFVEHPRLNMKE